MKRLRLSRKSCSIIFFVLLILFISGIAFASSGGDHGAQDHEHAAKSKGWIATDTYRVMNFAVLAIGLFLLCRKPLSRSLRARIKGIREQLSELETKKKEAEKTLAEYNTKIASLEQEAEKIMDLYIEQGKATKGKIIKEAEAAAVKLEEQARRNIENEFKNARIKLQEEIIEKALIKAEELVKNTITSEDQDRLVDEYLNKVVA